MFGPDVTPRPNEAGIDVEVAAIDLRQLVRLSAMMQSLLVEARDMALDDDAPARRRLAEVQRHAIDSITSVVPTSIAEELNSLSPPVLANDPSEGELRLAQSQVTGWLSGLFQAFQFVAL